jgi:selenide,water dikinase
VAAVFAAADAQVRAAGALLAGGHTIRDDEAKYGLAVVGLVHPDGVWQKSTARPGDAVFLTKPLGTGLVLQGHKRGLVPDAALEDAVAWMRTLNRDAADALRAFAPSAVTDVTGFGLLGHAHETAARSGVRLVLEGERWPALAGALDVARAGEHTGGDRRNRDFAGAHVQLDGTPDDLVTLGYDPQTAGGLLATLPADRAAVLEASFASRGLFLQRIGRVEEGSGVVVV